MRVQYAETDFDFVNRLLEDIGVTYYFEQSGGDTALVLADCPNNAAPRAPLPFVSQPNLLLEHEYVTAVHTRRQVRPGRYTQSDVDYRKALDYPLASSAAKGDGVESQLERYHHNYGSFLWKTDAGGDTPYADDRGPARTNERAGATQVAKRLDAQRVDARVCSFTTVAHDLRPGKVLTIAGHPRAEVGAPLLVVAATFTGDVLGAGWTHTCEARYTDVDYRPPLRTPKPRTLGVESATVTGPAGEEIHTDEFGRLRVHFHWDREGAADETSSCWVPQSQPWAGAGFGSTNLARVGQEVLIDFLGADPDRPVVVGRVYTTTTPPPYQLPKYKMVSGHRSESYPRPKSGPTQRLGGGPATLGGAPPWVVPADPAGGGAPVGRLGSGGDAGPQESAASPVSSPGDRGGAPISQQDLAGKVTGGSSTSCDGQDHNRSANGLTHDDTAGSEVMYLQAQKNLYETVKCDLITVVGANCVCNVAKNNSTYVGGYDSTTVNLDRSVTVWGEQSHSVTKDISVVSGKNITTTTPYGEQSHQAQKAITLAVDSGGKLTLQVGAASTIILMTDAIVIDAPNVYINPGPVMMASLASNHSSQDAAAAQKAANAKQEAADATAKTLQERQELGDRLSNSLSAGP